MHGHRYHYLFLGDAGLAALLLLLALLLVPLSASPGVRAESPGGLGSAVVRGR